MSSAAVTPSQQMIVDAVRPAGAEGGSTTSGQHASWLNRSCQRLALVRLSRLQNGRICLDDRNARFVVGENSRDNLQATITVRNPRFYRRLVTGRSLGMAEAYLDGDFECDDLPSLFRIFSRNLE